MNGYLIDTNILIYYFADTIPPKEIDTLERILKTSFNVSVITKIEFLGWKRHTDEGYEKAKEFISFAHTIPLNNKIADMAIKIRRKNKIKLPDAVIASTALSNDFTLVTRNANDFKVIENLKIYNPYQMIDG